MCGNKGPQDPQRDLMRKGGKIRKQCPHTPSLPGSGLSQWADSDAIAEAGEIRGLGDQREAGREAWQGEILNVSR